MLPQVRFILYKWMLAVQWIVILRYVRFNIKHWSSIDHIHSRKIHHTTWNRDKDMIEIMYLEWI